MRRGLPHNLVLWISDKGTKICNETGVATQFSLPFLDGKWVTWKKVKTSNISGTIQPIFFILSPCVRENNGLLNKN